MNKLWSTIKDKAMTAIVWFMLSTGAIFLYNVGLDIWYLPKTVKHLKELHVKDSTLATVYIRKVDSLSFISRKHSRRMYKDSLNIQEIKTKLKIK